MGGLNYNNHDSYNFQDTSTADHYFFVSTFTFIDTDSNYFDDKMNIPQSITVNDFALILNGNYGIVDSINADATYTILSMTKIKETYNSHPHFGQLDTNDLLKIYIAKMYIQFTNKNTGIKYEYTADVPVYFEYGFHSGY